MKFRKLAALVTFGLLTFSSQSHAAKENFDIWLAGLKAQALNKGISQEIIDEALSGVTAPVPRIIELDKKQPESRLTLAQYQRNVVNQTRIDKGRKLYKQHRAALEKAAQKYGVPAPYIVALWGIETNYGSHTGGFKVPEALATLAYDGRRARFFRSELLEALQILQDGHITPEQMKGSWAGAMGQCQFMPSSFKIFAVDGNGDGKRDIWTTLPDVFASTANYLSESGWAEDQRWGRAVRLPAGFDRQKISKDKRETLRTWKEFGLLTMEGAPIPVVANMEASLIQPDGVGTQAYLVYNNFRVLLKWNRSTYFASSVGLLAEKIAS